MCRDGGAGEVIQFVGGGMGRRGGEIHGGNGRAGARIRGQSCVYGLGNGGESS